MSITIDRPAGALHPDAELIRTCHRFAEYELASWYRYVLDNDDDSSPDHATYISIIATPATTPEGWHAKALAFTAWDRDSYDDHEDVRDGCSSLLASLLRDMVAPARNAIIAGLRAKHGPLPAGYSPDGIWIGYSSEEKAAIETEHKAMVAARKAAKRAEHSSVTIKAGHQELHGMDVDGKLYRWSDGNVQPVDQFQADASGHIEGGHYVIGWKGHAVTVHCHSAGEDYIGVSFMCNSGPTLYMRRWEAENILLGKKIPDPEQQAKITESLKRLGENLHRAQTAPHLQRGVATHV